MHAQARIDRSDFVSLKALQGFTNKGGPLFSSKSMVNGKHHNCVNENALNWIWNRMIIHSFHTLTKLFFIVVQAGYRRTQNDRYSSSFRRFSGLISIQAILSSQIPLRQFICVWTTSRVSSRHEVSRELFFLSCSSVQVSSFFWLPRELRFKPSNGRYSGDMPHGPKHSICVGCPRGGPQDHFDEKPGELLDSSLWNRHGRRLEMDVADL
jgi:hypothetical protein